MTSYSRDAGYPVAGPSEPSRLCAIGPPKMSRRRHVAHLRAQDVAAQTPWLCAEPLRQSQVALEAVKAGAFYLEPVSSAQYHDMARLWHIGNERLRSACTNRERSWVTTKEREPEGEVGSTTQDARNRTDQPAHVKAVGTKSKAQDDDAIHLDIAIKYLAAGGLAGAISRTISAPFDRLKVFLITTDPNVGTTRMTGTSAVTRAFQKLSWAAQTIHAQGGVRSWWKGNAINASKVFPESGIRYSSYELFKRQFARHVDHVQDARDISGTSRLLSGGLAGFSAQLSMHPCEVLKTRFMVARRGTTLVEVARRTWAEGKFRAFYRGCSLSLIGVVPLSSIEMFCYDGLKRAYIKYSKGKEPGTLPTLAIGSIAGSVSASAVYPIQVVRVQLQAGLHGTRVASLQVARSIIAKEGLAGLYKGLAVSNLKVAPSVATSWLCYEQIKKYLGVL